MVAAMKPAYALCLLVTLSSLLLFTACPSDERTTAVLSTNRPEFTSYAELFNSSQNEYRLVIAYNDAPRTQLSGNGTYDFDLVIDVQLNSQ